VIDANQKGNARYLAAPQVQQKVTVTGLPQTINFTSEWTGNEAVNGTYDVAATGGGSDNPVTFGVDSSSTSGTCTISGAVVTFHGAGYCVIDANQLGNARYLAAPQDQQKVPVLQTITFTSTAPESATLKSTYAVMATGGPSGTPVTFSVGSSTTSQTCTISAATASGTAASGATVWTATVTFVGPGDCYIYANQASNALYPAARQASQTVEVDADTPE
jgi:hypothetical protein